MATKIRRNIVYTKKEQKERMQDFEREVRKAREAWRLGYAVVILSIQEYFRFMTIEAQAKTFVENIGKATITRASARAGKKGVVRR